MAAAGPYTAVTHLVVGARTSFTTAGADSGSGGGGSGGGGGGGMAGLLALVDACPALTRLDAAAFFCATATAPRCNPAAAAAAVRDPTAPRLVLPPPRAAWEAEAGHVRDLQRHLGIGTSPTAGDTGTVALDVTVCTHEWDYMHAKLDVPYTHPRPNLPRHCELVLLAACAVCGGSVTAGADVLVHHTHGGPASITAATAGTAGSGSGSGEAAHHQGKEEGEEGGEEGGEECTTDGCCEFCGKAVCSTCCAPVDGLDMHPAACFTCVPLAVRDAYTREERRTYVSMGCDTPLPPVHWDAARTAAKLGRAAAYRADMATLVEAWRQRWA